MRSIQEWRELHKLFHTLWSKAVGTEGYDKQEWKRLEAAVFAEAPPSFMA